VPRRSVIAYAIAALVAIAGCGHDSVTARKPPRPSGDPNAPVRIYPPGWFGPNDPPPLTTDGPPASRH